MIQLKFFGIGGQGIVTAAKMLSEAVSLGEGKFASTVPAYGHERRGAPVNTSIVVDDEPVLQNCFVYEPDLVMVLDPGVVDKGVNVAAGIHPESILVLNTSQMQTVDRFAQMGFKKVYYADGTQVAAQETGRGIPNASMLGALAKTGLVGIEAVAEAVEHTFGKKAGAANAQAARRVYDETKCNCN